MEGHYDSNAKITAKGQSKWPNLFPNNLFSNRKGVIAHTFPVYKHAKLFVDELNKTLEQLKTTKVYLIGDIKGEARSFQVLFWGGHLFVFVECLCCCSPRIETGSIGSYGSVLAIVNRRNWLDDLPPFIN